MAALFNCMEVPLLFLRQCRACTGQERGGVEVGGPSSHGRRDPFSVLMACMPDMHWWTCSLPGSVVPGLAVRSLQHHISTTCRERVVRVRVCLTSDWQVQVLGQQMCRSSSPHHH